jgi:hypothetical protein
METTAVAQVAQASFSEGSLFTLVLFGIALASMIIMFGYLAMKAPNKAQRSVIRAEHDAQDRQSSMRAAG